MQEATGGPYYKTHLPVLGKSHALGGSAISAMFPAMSQLVESVLRGPLRTSNQIIISKFSQG